SIADDYGVKAEILAVENSIQTPFFITPGDRLSIPSRDTETLSEALKPPAEDISTTSLEPLPLIKETSEPTPTTETLSASNVALPEDLANEIAKEKGTPSSSSKPPLMGDLS